MGQRLSRWLICTALVCSALTRTSHRSEAAGARRRPHVRIIEEDGPAVTPAAVSAPSASTVQGARVRPPVLPVLRPPEDSAVGRSPAVRWWAVDGHVHTGVTRDAEGTTVAGVVAQGQRIGLDAVVITEHNMVHAPADLRGSPSVRVWSGEEAGFEGGHLLVWGGLHATRLHGGARTLAEVVDAPRGVSRRDVLAVLAHPGWALGRDLLGPTAVRRPDGTPLVDAVEVWNGQLDWSTERVLGRWEALLFAGIYVPVVGFSDSHHQHVGWPRTMVLAKDPSLHRLVRALRLGRSYVTDDAWAELDVLGKTFGGHLLLPGPMPLLVRVRVGSRLGGRFRLLVDGVEVASEVLLPGQTVDRCQIVGAGPRDGWLRIELRRRGGTLRGGEAAVLIGNPVRWDVVPLGDFWR